MSHEVVDSPGTLWYLRFLASRTTLFDPIIPKGEAEQELSNILLELDEELAQNKSYLEAVPLKYTAAQGR